MTKFEDLPLVERSEVVFTITIPREQRDRADNLAIQNEEAARALAERNLVGDVTLGSQSWTYEIIDDLAVEDLPSAAPWKQALTDFYGIKYTWKVFRIG